MNMYVHIYVYIYMCIQVHKGQSTKKTTLQLVRDVFELGRVLSGSQ
jgi:hypothetical protein